MAGVEICPYCRKPFKRLKSHLPHCKLAGEASSAFVSGEPFSLDTKASNSVTPKYLHDEKKKGQAKSPGASPDKENKKGKPDVARNKAKIKAGSMEPVDAAGSSTPGKLHALKSDEDTQKQMKWVPEKRHKTEGSKRAAFEEVRADAQPAEKVPLATERAKKSSSKQKSSSKTTASTPTLEPQPQNGEWSAEFPSQTAKRPARQKQTKEQKVPGCLDPSVGEHQPAPRGTADRVELVIENHRARVLRRRHKSPAQNILPSDASGSNHRTGCRPVESSPGGAETTLAAGQQLMAVTEMGDREGPRPARTVWLEETGNAVTEVKTLTPDENHFLDNGQEISGVAAGVRSLLGENRFAAKGEAVPQESPAYHSPEPNRFPSSTEAFRERGKAPNKYLRYLEQDTALDSETVVTVSQHSGMSVSRPSFDALETTAAQWFSSPESGTQPGSLGLEWFPALYSNYHRLGLFSRRPFQWDTKVPEAQVLILPSEAQQVSLAERCLMNVKLQDLPAWVATRDLSPQGVLGAPCRAWNRYYNRYINVKKGQVAGISMLLLGYCVLSYGWRYEHLKHSRWRKYH